MKKLLLVMTCTLALGLSGCVVFEAIFGISHPAGKGSPPVADGTGGIGGQILGYLIPGAAAVAASAAAAYANAKRRDWKAAALSTFEALSAFKDTDLGQKAWAELKPKLISAHTEAEITDFVQQALKKLSLDKLASDSIPG